jgi:hypothetical protein
MSKLKIFIYHLLVFIFGSTGIIAYIFYRLSSLSGEASVGGIIVMPAVMLVYVVAFGIFCACSFGLSLLIRYLRR